MLREVGDKLDLDRVHFLGQIPYDAYLNLLQVSSAHVYLTYPFVLAAVVFTMLLTGLLSVAGPVRRVLHVDPAKLLREQ